MAMGGGVQAAFALFAPPQKTFRLKSLKDQC